MWYRLSQIKNVEDYEEKIIRNDAENIIRMHFRLKGNYNVDTLSVNRLIKKTIEEIKRKYGKCYLLRNHIRGGELRPIVEKTINDIFPKKNYFSNY